MNCRALEQSVLNTKPTKEVVEELGVRTIVADFSNRDPVIAALLDQLQGSIQLPFLVIFPAGQPEKAIRVSGLYKRDWLIEKLREAGPSASKPGESKTVIDTDEPAVIMSQLP